MKIFLWVWLVLSPIQLMARVIKDDFLVNDDTIGAPPNYFPDVAMNGKGRFVVVWHDAREVTCWGLDNMRYTFEIGYHPVMYGQVYDSSGRPIGENFKINEGRSVWGNPAVAMDSSGNFVVVWIGAKETGCILGKRFNSSGKPIGDEFQISSKPPTLEGSWDRPAIAMHPSGDFVVVWKQREGGGMLSGSLCARMYDRFGNPKGGIIKIDTGLVFVPSVAMNYSGDFVVIWWRAKAWEIEVRRYNKFGEPKGKKSVIVENCFSALHMPPMIDIAMDSAGNFSVVWENDGDIYFQPFNYNGSPLDSVRKVNDDSVEDWDPCQIWPTISMDKSGRNIVIAWHDNRNTSRYNLITDIYAQRYDFQYHPIGRNFQVDEKREEFYEREACYPSVAMDDSGNFVVVWVDDRGRSPPYSFGHHHVYGQRYNSKGEEIDGNFRITDGGTDVQFCPSVSMNKKGDFVTVWVDFRRDCYDIYAQRYDKWGNLMKSNFQVNDDTVNGWEMSGGIWNPRCAINEKGEFVITWMDGNVTDFGFSIYYAIGQGYDSSGERVGENFFAYPREPNPFLGTWYEPALAMKDDGNFFLVGSDEIDNSANLYGAFFDIRGNPMTDFLGPLNEKPLSPIFLHYNRYALTIDGAGNFIAVWLLPPMQDSSGPLYGQRLDNMGNILGKNFRIDELGTVRLRGWPCVDADDKGNFVVVWEDLRDDSLADIFCQRFDSESNPIGKNFKVNDDPPGSMQRHPSVAMNPSTSEFVVFWTDFRYKDPVVMAQKYDGYGNPVGGNVRISKNTGSYQFAWRNSVDACEDRIVFVWTDNRRDKCWDVYCKITDWGLLGIEEERKRTLTRLKVFPNPAKKVIDIRYEIPIRGKISLKLYDVSGRVAKTLLRAKSTEPGIYRMNIDTKDLPNDFLRLSLCQAEPCIGLTRKIIVLK